MGARAPSSGSIGRLFWAWHDSGVWSAELPNAMQRRSLHESSVSSEGEEAPAAFPPVPVPWHKISGSAGQSAAAGRKVGGSAMPVARSASGARAERARKRLPSCSISVSVREWTSAMISGQEPERPRKLRLRSFRVPEEDRMNIHNNARLTPIGRERIVRQVASGQTPQDSERSEEETTDATSPGRVFRDCPYCSEIVVLPARQRSLLSLRERLLDDSRRGSWYREWR